MGLGPMWQSKFIHPAPPADATPEELRYIQQLHDQLTVSFEEVQQVSNQVIIGGDGDGGPGPSDTTETDGGSITYDGSSLSFSDDPAQFIDLTWAMAANTFQSGWRIRQVTGKIGTADIDFHFRGIATKAWTTVNFFAFHATAQDFSVDVSCNYTTIVEDDDWDVSLTAATENPVTLTPASNNEIVISEFTLTGVVASDLMAIKITIGNWTNTNDRSFKFPCIVLSQGDLPV